MKGRVQSGFCVVSVPRGPAMSFVEAKYQVIANQAGRVHRFRPEVRHGTPDPQGAPALRGELAAGRGQRD